MEQLLLKKLVYFSHSSEVYIFGVINFSMNSNIIYHQLSVIKSVRRPATDGSLFSPRPRPNILHPP